MKIFDHTGEKVGLWNIVKKLNESQRGTSIYLAKCACGHEKVASFDKISRTKSCISCASKQKSLAHIGKKNGRLTCIGLTDDRHRRLIIRCECGLEYTMKGINQLTTSSKCKSCSRGFYPGLIIEGITMIERVASRTWKMKCHCGKIYEKVPNYDHGKFYDCGCVAKNKYLSEAEKKIGLKLGYLTVMKVLPSENSHLQLLLKCKCGKTITRSNGHEFKGYSCGCASFTAMPKGEKHVKATLKNCDIISMRELYESGVYTEMELAEIHGKPKEYIRRIIRKQIWKHV